ncbi:MAG TPA: ABC transporter transmembrane domain-containing protein, partial [Aestuariivirga sp.]|nr:ABC transporter transmembrane domain-containing protein [Aestuariivirga sp.]
MRQVLKIFFTAEGTRPWLVLLGLFLASLAEALGITTLLPAAAAILDPNSGSSGVGAMIRAGMARFGITPTVGSMLAVIVFLMVARALLSFAAMVYAGVTAARVSINLRKRLIAAVFNARWRFYSGERSGRLANAISNDATRAGDAYNLAAALAANGFQLIAYATIAILVDWRVAL